LAIVASDILDEETAFSLASVLAAVVEAVLAALAELVLVATFSFVAGFLASAATAFFVAELFFEGAFVATMDVTFREQLSFRNAWNLKSRP
jgi:hypothetical protein